jgi:hypothetical protein
MGLLDILNQVVGGNAGGAGQFSQVAQAAPVDVLGKGLAEAFRSNQTPPIGDLVGQLFGNSNGQQQAGMLNQVLATLGPAAASALAGGALGRVLSPGATHITPDQAAQVSPDEVAQIVDHAHAANPNIADQLGGFYAQHSALLNTLGSAALAVAMAKMKDHMSQT